MQYVVKISLQVVIHLKYEMWNQGELFSIFWLKPSFELKKEILKSKEIMKGLKTSNLG